MRQLTLWTVILSLLAALAVGATSPQSLAKAIESQTALAAEQPYDAALRNDLGNLLRLARRLGEAEQAYRQAIELAPDKPTPRYNLAVLLQEKGEASAALKELRAVLRLAPNHAWAHYQIGMIAELAGDESRAIEAYARAFALDHQLTFSDVNPHIIENRHLTAALIRSYQRSQGAPQAPNAYEDPGRIAALLVPPLGAQAPPPAAAEGKAEAGEDRARRPEGEGGGQPPGDGRVLSEGDLDPDRALGQASPLRPGASARRGGSRTGTAPQSRALNPSSRYGEEPDKDEEDSPPAGRAPGSRVHSGVTGFGVPGAPAPPRQPTVTQPGGQRPGGGGTRFRPGVGSTGRLSLEVLPPLAERAG